MIGTKITPTSYLKTRAKRAFSFLNSEVYCLHVCITMAKMIAVAMAIIMNFLEYRRVYLILSYI